jgi:hypothetical protein
MRNVKAAMNKVSRRGASVWTMAPTNRHDAHYWWIHEVDLPASSRSGTR